MSRLPKNIKKGFALSKSKGFTLIELLIVIAILGVLVISVLSILNPAEQTARSRDAGRKTVIAQLGTTIQSFYAQSGQYPAANEAWMKTLIDGGELKSVQYNSNAAGYIGCAAGSNQATSDGTTGGTQTGYCYKYDPTTVPPAVIIYSRAESKASATTAGASGSPCVQANTWIVWSSGLNKTGLWCATSTAEPTVAGVTVLK